MKPNLPRNSKAPQPKIPEHTTEDPFILRVIELSTVHITKADSDLLERDDTPFTVYDMEYGCMLFCDTWCVGREHDIAQFGFSAAFMMIVRLAWSHKCSWIRLDCDGFVYDDLPKFKW